MRGRIWTLGFLAASGAYLAGSLTFPLGSVAKPGPGFFPVGIGVFLCGAAVALTIAAVRGAPFAAAGVPAEARLRVAVTVAGLVGFCLLLPWLGYPACAFLFVGLLLRYLGGAGLAGVLVTAAASALVTHYLFGVLLGVPLPRGPF